MNSVIIISKWEKGWMEPKVEAHQWVSLIKAYNVDELLMVPIKNVVGRIKEYETIENALNQYDYPRVFLEPSKNKKIIKNKLISLYSFNHPTNCIYIFGNSASGNSSFIRKDDAVVYIPTPKGIELWGVVACGIVLQDRANKLWQSQ